MSPINRLAVLGLTQAMVLACGCEHVAKEPPGQDKEPPKVRVDRSEERGDLPWVPSQGETYRWGDDLGHRIVEMKMLEVKDDIAQIWLTRSLRYYKPRVDEGPGARIPHPLYDKGPPLEGMVLHTEMREEVLTLHMSRLLIAVADMLPTHEDFALNDEPLKWSKGNKIEIWGAPMGKYYVEVMYCKDDTVPSVSRLLFVEHSSSPALTFLRPVK